jgi:gephyrin
LINSGSLLNANVTVRECVADELNDISAKLVIWADELNLNLIFTTGGTGFSPRDVTPEATKIIIEREAPGLSLVRKKKHQVKKQLTNNKLTVFL